MFLRSYAFMRKQKEKRWCDPKPTKAIWQVSLQHPGILKLPNSTTSDCDGQENKANVSHPHRLAGVRVAIACHLLFMQRSTRESEMASPTVLSRKRIQKVAKKAQALLNSHAAEHDWNIIDAEVILKFIERGKTLV